MHTLYPHDPKTADPKTGKPSPAVKIFDTDTQQVVYVPQHVLRAMDAERKRAEAALKVKP